MATRAVPPAVPVWGERPYYASLGTDISADVAIVGAGFSGLIAALELRAAGVGVVVVEAGQPGRGASGHNAGHVGPMFYGGTQTPAGVIRRLGEERGRRLNERVAASGAWLFDLVERHNIACDARRGYLCVARSDASAGKLRDRFEAWSPFGGRFRRVDRSDLTQHVVSPRYAGGVWLPDGGWLNPAKFVRGLSQALVREGGQLFGESPVVRIEPEGGRWRVRTSAGSVSARQLLVATGACAESPAPELRACSWPVPCGVAASEPLDDRGRSLLPRGGPIVDLDDKAIFAPVIDGADRLVVSMLLSQAEPVPGDSLAPVYRRLARAFPEFEAPRFTRLSAGSITVTPDGLPRLLDLGAGRLAVTGCNGFGLTLGILAAREAARVMIGGRASDLDLPLSQPKPLPASRLVPMLFRSVMAPLANRFAA